MYYLTAKGQCVESDKIKGGFKYLLYSDENTMLVGITEELILIVFNIDGRGVANRVFEVHKSHVYTCIFHYPISLIFLGQVKCSGYYQWSCMVS